MTKKDIKKIKEHAKQKNVLYIEDDVIMNVTLKESLKMIFNECYSAEHGQEALDIFKNKKTDLIITDLEMPVMDGIKFIETIKNIEKTTPPIIVTSAYNDVPEYFYKLLNLGIENNLTKPFNTDELLKAIYKAFFE